MSLLNSQHEYVYLLEEIENTPTDYVKIGSTVNSADARAAQLQTSNPRGLKVYAVLRTDVGQSLIKEKELHDLFKHLQANLDGGTEWFNDHSGHIKRYFHAMATSPIHSVPIQDLNNFKFWLEELHKFSSGIYHQTFEFVKSEVIPELTKRNVIVLAPPKSGKKIMVQSSALLLPQCKHILLTAQDKQDMNSQLQEYKPYDVISVSVVNKANLVKTLRKDLLDEISKYSNTTVVVHYDECDFGSRATPDGKKDGEISRYIKQIQEALNNTTNNTLRWVVYSATPEEAVFSYNDYHLAHFKPSINYNGPSWFIGNGLCTDPESFISVDNGNLVLSDQAIEILDGQLLSDKPYSVVRLNYKIGKDQAFNLANDGDSLQKAIDSKYGVGKIKVNFYRSGKAFDWSFWNKAEAAHGTWKGFPFSQKRLIIINNFCTRGTEVGFHPAIYAWHDYRKREVATTTYGTYAQAAGRVFHYGSDYQKPERVAVFGNLDTKIKLYVEKSLLEIMIKIYSASSKEAMKLLWKDYTQRDIGSRVSTQVRSDYDLLAEPFASKEEAVEYAKKYYGNSPNWKSHHQYPANLSENKRDLISDYPIYKILNGTFPSKNEVIYWFNGCLPEYKELWDKIIQKHPDWKDKYVVLRQGNKSSKTLIKSVNNVHSFI